MPHEPPAYRLSPLARADLEQIWAYTFRTWSLQQADAYYTQIVNVIEDLVAGRKLGRIVDVRSGYWKYPAGLHVVYFRKTDCIDVIRILHGKMDVSRHL